MSVTRNMKMAKQKYIAIENVDTAELEQQRKRLHRLLHKLTTPPFHHPTQAEIDALEGVLNMLDSWSDKRWYKRKRKRLGLTRTPNHEFVVSASPVCDAHVMKKLITRRIGRPDGCGFDYVISLV